MTSILLLDLSFTKRKVFASGAIIPFFPPASMAILHSVILSSTESIDIPSPANSIALYVAPSTPISPIICRIMSFAIRYGGTSPSKTNFIVVGTFNHSLPVPIIKAASVLPIPVANSPKAPAVHVCESVPKSTSPGLVCPSSARATWHTPL